MNPYALALGAHLARIFDAKTVVTLALIGCATWPKSRVKWHGYGQSVYNINRGYVRQVLRRAPAYREEWHP